jgi:preprotein translocase subunit YajC
MIQPFLAFLFQGDSSTAPGGAPAGGPGGAPPQGSLGDSLMGMAVPMLLCIVVFWVFMIGPERKQRKKREEMLKNLKKGDDVVTTGGLYGSIVQVQDGVVTLQVADGVRMRFALASIGSVTPNETAAKS